MNVILDNEPAASSPLGTRFSNLRNGIEREGHKRYPRLSDLIEDVREALSLARNVADNSKASPARDQRPAHVHQVLTNVKGKPIVNAAGHQSKPTYGGGGSSSGSNGNTSGHDELRKQEARNRVRAIMLKVGDKPCVVPDHRNHNTANCRYFENLLTEDPVKAAEVLERKGRGPAINAKRPAPNAGNAKKRKPTAPRANLTTVTDSDDDVIMYDLTEDDVVNEPVIEEVKMDLYKILRVSTHSSRQSYRSKRRLTDSSTQNMYPHTTIPPPTSAISNTMPNSMMSETARVMMDPKGKSREVYAAEGVQRARRIKGEDVMMLDTGASVTMTPHYGIFIPGSYKPCQHDEWVYLGDQSPIEVLGKGNVAINFGDTARMVKDVYHVPKLQDTLISIAQVLEGTRDCIIFGADFVSFYHYEQKNMVEIGRRRGDLYYIKVIPARPKNQVALTNSRTLTRPLRKDRPYLLWHAILNHASPEIVMNTLKRSGKSFDFSRDSNECSICLQTKATRIRTAVSDSPPASRYLERLDLDTIPLPGITRYKKKYALIIVDRFTRYIWALWLRRKNEGVPLFLKFADDLMMKSGIRIHSLGCDGEFSKYKAFRNWCDAARPTITIYVSPPHTQELNGGVERWIGLLARWAGSLLITARLKTPWFQFAMDHAVAVSRALAFRSTKKQTPFELANSKMDKIERLHPFGCLVAVYVPKKQRKGRVMTVTRALPGIFLGYKGQTIVLAYLFNTRQVHEAYHVRFCDTIFPGLTPTDIDLHPFQNLQFDSFSALTNSQITGGDGKDDESIDPTVDIDEQANYPGVAHLFDESDSDDGENMAPEILTSGTLVAGENGKNRCIREKRVKSTINPR